jgi:hypothetical protein
MEVLETARVDAYAQNSIIVPAAKRAQVVCVVWEGTLSERVALKVGQAAPLLTIPEETGAVWHAGDWTGPLSLQPDLLLSGESRTSHTHDVVTTASVGAKVITIEYSSLHSILKTGSALYRKYLERKTILQIAKLKGTEAASASMSLEKKDYMEIDVLELLNSNSAFRKLNAVQKRHLESLAEGPVTFAGSDRMWSAGAPVDKAFLIVSGTATFMPKRRNAGSAVGYVSEEDTPTNLNNDQNVGASMHVDAMKAITQLGDCDESDHDSMVNFEQHGIPAHDEDPAFAEEHDFAQLSRGLQKRAEYLSKEGSVTSENMSYHDTEADVGMYEGSPDHDAGQEQRAPRVRRRSSRARFVNKVLGRLYSRRAYTSGLVFSRGHFLGDASKMVAGLLANDVSDDAEASGPLLGSPSNSDLNQYSALMASLSDMALHEQEVDQNVLHSSTLTAGKDGCVALVFPKSTLILFLDDYPGLLLSLLGTQVVV